MSIAALALLLLYHVTTCQEEEFVEKFVATSEWAQIKEGQSIPKGLHVRMDLSTGIREAKLILDTDSLEETGRIMLRDDNVIDVGVVDRDDTFPVDGLEEGLKNVANSRDSSETVSGRFRTIDELKQSMPNMEMKTEGQVLRDAMILLNSTSDQDIASLIIILEDLDDLAHKYDNGKLLVTQGWMTKIGDFLFHSNEDVYKGAVRVMSSAAQSNPEVQAHCIEQGYLGTLISKLLTQPDRLAKSTVFAISAIVRNLPAALDTFVSLHGFNTISTKLALSSYGPLQRAILTLYNDMLEHDSQAGVSTTLTNLERAGTMLCKTSDNLIAKEDASLDLIEQTVLFYSHIQHFCSQDINDNVRTRLKFLQSSPDHDDEELQDTLRRVLS